MTNSDSSEYLVGILTAWDDGEEQVWLRNDLTWPTLVLPRISLNDKTHLLNTLRKDYRMVKRKKLTKKQKKWLKETS